MSELTSHYLVLLALDGSWEVEAVDLKRDVKRVEIAALHRGERLV